jgi:hypothetical protein
VNAYEYREHRTRKRDSRCTYRFARDDAEIGPPVLAKMRGVKREENHRYQERPGSVVRL